MLSNKIKAASEAVIRPSAENVLPLNQYINTQPRLLGENQQLKISDDMIILFGGGRDFKLSVWGYKGAEATEKVIDNVELFILNKCIIIWLKNLDKGIEIKYTGVIYHGANKINDNTSREGHKLELLITVIRDDLLNSYFPTNDTEEDLENSVNDFTMDSIEFKLTPKHSTYDRFYSDEVETLFTFNNFGSNRGDDMVINCNKALEKCLELSGNEFNRFGNPIAEDSEEELDQEEVEQANPNTAVMGFNETINTYYSSGNADDLDNDYILKSTVVENDTDAGMSMQFYNSSSLVTQKRSFQ
ncbi:hypothetical protein TPHA_0B02030 [Tetrapisispora phaffii CBS 4417]|uniref:Protein LOT5 n=1 Tax=Tetrapisispora phaffii (strain ATCC 24235 / CBS 4417 / NBRC 1672 / NRRL Y-8282 / UCD 70-5) TaxID=1071381 RepID=G8BPE4_TETPH|nr:hypothetical protein TPHA_0B02030 [Tetrapisispora phaffii CBS 4417]CCE61875.1 hypothetical protein TPHA_0B02030 [Tetrapisispora phaffii CBS 4417]